MESSFLPPKEIKKEVSLDTSSLNVIFKDDDLYNRFMSEIKKKDFRVIIPWDALVELSVDKEMIKIFLQKKIHDQAETIQICEPVPCLIRREITNKIKGYHYLNKEDISPEIFDDEILDEQKDFVRKQKKLWKENYKKIQKDFLLDHPSKTSFCIFL